MSLNDQFFQRSEFLPERMPTCEQRILEQRSDLFLALPRSDRKFRTKGRRIFRRCQLRFREVRPEDKTYNFGLKLRHQHVYIKPSDSFPDSHYLVRS
jgi:hypothetical protein